MRGGESRELRVEWGATRQAWCAETAVMVGGHMKRYPALAAMSLLLACNSGWSRPIELWTAEKLLRRADVVVIATVASSEDTENTDRFLEEFLVQRKTRLRVEAVLKGHDVAPIVTLVLNRELKRSGCREESGVRRQGGSEGRGFTGLVAAGRAVGTSGASLCRLRRLSRGGGRGRCRRRGGGRWRRCCGRGSP